MHSVAFEAKRAHWAMNSFGAAEFRRRFVVEGVAELEHMTPARFDIMFLIHEAHRQWPTGGYSMMQKDITKALGLDRSSVFKSLEKMVELGLVTRERFHETRYRVVELTKLGIRALRAALYTVFTEHRLRTHIESFVDAKVLYRRSTRRFQRGPIVSWLVTAMDKTRSFAEHFGRTYPILYYLNVAEED